jgi:hypothetical protein
LHYIKEVIISAEGEIGLNKGKVDWRWKSDPSEERDKPG